MMGMEYTVQQLAELAGVSARTLRYYDDIGLLKPARISSSGYRIYGTDEVDQLQQILFYKELGISLNQIKKIMSSSHYNRLEALRDHRKQLLLERKRLDQLIANVEKTIASIEGRMVMSDQEKFEGFKQKLIQENEARYGKEIRLKYGDEAVEKSNQKVKNMTVEQFEEVAQLEKKLFETLEKAFETKDPASNMAQQVAELHKQWLMYFWHQYSKEAHAGLAQMYVDDERFRAYYEKKPGMTEFLRDTIHIYTGYKS